MVKCCGVRPPSLRRRGRGYLIRKIAAGEGRSVSVRLENCALDGWRRPGSLKIPQHRQSQGIGRLERKASPAKGVASAPEVRFVVDVAHSQPLTRASKPKRAR